MDSDSIWYDFLKNIVCLTKICDNWLEVIIIKSQKVFD